MGCLPTKVNDDSKIWTNIQHSSNATRTFGATSHAEVFHLDPVHSKESKNKRCKTYFEPCLLYINEPGHKNYHLNDLGLYEQDIEFTLGSKKSTQQQKRPKCPGLWTDRTFDETKFNFLEDFSLRRPREIHPDACFLVDYIDDRDVYEGDTECTNFTTNVLLLATDQFLLQRVLPDEEDHFKSKKYDGVFHCRLCRLGIWEDVYVDDRIPVGSDGFICGSSSTIENEMWIPLLEKAYAKFWGDYDAMKRRRFLEVFRTLTGGTGEEINFLAKRYDPVYIANRIDTALQNGCSIVCTVSQRHDGVHNLTGRQVFTVKETLTLGTQKSKEVRLVKLRNPLGFTEWTGQWSPRSTEWTTVTCRHKPTLVDGEFYMSIENMVKYMECLTICNLIPEQDKLNTEQRSNYITKIYSEWKGKTAAGLNYLKNPKYMITISDKGIENDGKIRLVIILEQLMCPGSTDNTVSIRVKLYKVHTECREGVIVEDMTEQGICSRRISVTISHRVVPGKYIIVPHTDREDLEKEFMIVVYTPTPLPGVRLLDHQKPVLVSKPYNIVKIKGVQSELDHLNYNWGKWNLPNGQIHGEDFHKNPQFEITIPDGVSSCVVRFQLLKDTFQEEACIGFRLFKLNDCKEMPLNKMWIDAIWDDPVKCHDGSIEGWHWNYIEPTYLLQPGTYVAIVWADKPEYKCSFCLVVRVSIAIIIKSYN